MKRDYYEILELEMNCEQDQIKQNYRKLALKWHPDKNQSEDSKQKFQEIQEAYSVLSDPNERTWYDNHKMQILNPNVAKEDVETMEEFGFNIWQYFSPHYVGFGDDAQGFFAYYREAFEKIKYEEEKAYNNKIADSDEENNINFEKMPGFGISTTPIEQVLKFYQKWENFITFKTFAYADKYNPNEAPNRQVRRIIKQENQKERKEEKKKYTKTIKKLVETVKQRDIRYKEYLENQKKVQQIEEVEKAKQKAIYKKEMEEARRQARIAEQERFKENEEYFKERQQFEVILEKEQKEDNVIYCEICDKEFKSEQQMKNHQNSKIHKQNLKDLVGQITDDKLEQEKLIKQAMTDQNKESDIKQVEKEVEEQIQKELDKQIEKKQKKKQKKKNQSQKSLDQTEQIQKEQFQSEKNIVQHEIIEHDNSDEEQDMAFLLRNTKKEKQKRQKAQSSKFLQNEEDEQDQEQEQIEQKQNQEQQQKSKQIQQNQEQEIEKDDDQEESQQTQIDQEKKLNKAKLKRNKKKEQQQQQQGFKCNVCSQSFPSKTKLFNHLNETGHKAAK